MINLNSLLKLIISVAAMIASVPTFGLNRCERLERDYETLLHDTEGFIYQYHRELYRRGVVKAGMDHGVCGVACFINITNLVRLGDGKQPIHHPFDLVQKFAEIAKKSQGIDIADGMTMGELIQGIRQTNQQYKLLDGIRMQSREMQEFEKENTELFVSKQQLRKALSKGPIILGLSGFKNGHNDYEHYVVATQFKGNKLTIVDPIRPRTKLEATLKQAMTPDYLQKSQKLEYTLRNEPRDYYLTAVLSFFN